MAEFIRIGDLGDDGMGIRVVVPGADVENPTFAGMVLDTNHPTIRIVQAGQVQIASRAQGIVVPLVDQGFIPFVLAAMHTTEFLWNMGQWKEGTVLRPPEIFFEPGTIQGASFVWDGVQFKVYDGGELPTPHTSDWNSFYGVPQVDGYRYNRCIMPYMAYDDRSRSGWPVPVDEQRGREVGMFSVIVERTKLTITSWASPGGAPYFVKYAVLGVPTA